MSRTLTIVVPDAIVEKYATQDELARGLYEDIVIVEFQKGHLSIRESAGLLGMTYEEFMEWLGERRLPFINATEEELDQSYKEFEAFMQTYDKP